MKSTHDYLKAEGWENIDDTWVNPNNAYKVPISLNDAILFQNNITENKEKVKKLEEEGKIVTCNVDDVVDGDICLIRNKESYIEGIIKISDYEHTKLIKLQDSDINNFDDEEVMYLYDDVYLKKNITEKRVFINIKGWHNMTKTLNQEYGDIKIYYKNWDIFKYI